MTTLLLLRLDETRDAIRPADAIGNLAELDNETDLDAPPIVDAALGRGRAFDAAAQHGYRAQDIVPGATLLTRDCSIQAWLRWDLAGQNTAAMPGTVYARGKGSSAAEYVGAGLELAVVNAAQNVGQIRWLWHDVAGALKTQVGAHWKPSASGFVMITATRRWVSSTEVVLRYYLGDRLLGEYISTDGSIGGGTTGTTSIGARFSGGAWTNYLAGTLDELRVVDYELTAEEIAATWKRITVHQPAGYRLLLELHDPGFPISADPGSRVQKETRMWGNALGFASAQTENMRNFLPQRAYSTVLEDWETVLKQAPKPGDSVDTRRARCVARMRRDADGNGVSIPGVKAALGELVDTDPDNLEFLAFDQTVEDAFASLDTQRWTPTPAADWTILSGALRVQAIAGDFTAIPAWKTCLLAIGGEGHGAHVLAKITPTALPSGANAGVALAHVAKGDWIVLTLRNAGNFYVHVDTYRNGAFFASPVDIDLGASAPANIWLHLYQVGGVSLGGSVTLGNFRAAYSTTGPTSGFVESADFVCPIMNYWAGPIFTGSATTVAASDARFDDVRVRAPLGERSFFLYVYRNPALPGRPDLVGANHIIRQLKQAHTHAAVITNKQLLCDDPTTPCDLGPLGGI